MFSYIFLAFFCDCNRVEKLKIVNKIAFLPTKHLRVRMNSFKRVRAFQI